MNLYEKIGRLIKQNKIFNLSENCNTNSKSIDDSTLAQELDNIESFLSDILSPSKLDTKNININNKEFSKTDLEEAQNLIKRGYLKVFSCSFCCIRRLLKTPKAGLRAGM